MNRPPDRPTGSLAAFACELLEARTLLSGSLSPIEDISDGLRFIHAVDIDNDGDVDLLGQRESRDWVIRWNSGSGDFRSSTSVLAAAESYSWVVAIDQDGDGDRDLLARGVSGAVYRLSNVGSGAFDPPETLAGLSLTERLPKDLGMHEGSPQWLVLLSTGLHGVLRFRDGMVDIPAFPIVEPNQVAGIADLDADGDLDIALLVGLSAGRRMAFVVNDSGAFSRLSEFTSPGMGARFQDLDGDGRGDLWWTEGGRLYIADGVGDGTFQAPRLARVASGDEGAAEPFADLNGDGRVDALTFPHRPFADSVAASLQTPDGFFEYRSSRAVYSVSGEFASADIDGDGKLDLIRTIVATPWTTDIYRFLPGPTITSVTVDPNPTVGSLIVRVAVEPTQPAQNVTSVALFADTNANGLLDSSDLTLGTSTYRTNDGRFVFIISSFDIPIGDVRLFTTAFQEFGIPSAEVSTITNIWTRTFYPEGWRNDTTARERIVLFNPHDTPVAYRFLARYERGVRDGTVAEGTLQPGQRRTIIITNPNRPQNARVRKNVGYALELQSERRLSAMLEHFDTLGRDDSQTDFGALIGEQLTDQRAQTWTLPETYTSLDQFILFYNPNPNNVLVHVTFFGRDGVGISVEQLLEPFRRGGLSVSDVIGLRRNRAYSVLVTTETTQPDHGMGIVTSITSYDTSKGTGYTSLAFASDAASPTDLPLIELGAGRSTRVAVFNPSPSTLIIDVEISYNTGSSRSVTLTIPARQRVIMNPARYAPAGAIIARVQVAAPGGAWVTTTDSSRGDSAATTANRQASTWSFAQAHLSARAGSGPPVAGATDFTTLGLGNAGSDPAHLTLRFVFGSGQTVSSRLTIPAGSWRAIPLHTRRFITSIGGDFSIVVQSDRPVTAALSQWSTGPVWGPFPGARGGWWTLGTPLVA
jgi:hypothetical protein